MLRHRRDGRGRGRRDHKHQLYQAQPSIRGSVTPDATEHLSRDIELEVRETDQPGLVDQTTAVAGSGGATSSAPFAWQPTLAYNGNYIAVVTAWQANAVGIEDGPYNATQSFVLQAPPAKPDPPSVSVGADGASTSVSWKPNSEPDLLGYQLLRTPNYSGGKVPTIAKTDAHCSPTGCAYTDADITPATGYQYQVAAVRSAGPGTTSGVTASSNLSPKVLVPAPASSTTVDSSRTASPGTTAAATAQSTAPSAAPVAPALARTGRVDLSGFAALLDRSKAAARPAPEPDPGFQTALPYVPGQPEVGQGGAPAAAPARRARALGAPDRPSPVRPWAFFALGLLVTAVAVHLLWLRGEVRTEPGLEALPIPDAVPHPVPAPATARAPVPTPNRAPARGPVPVPVPVLDRARDRGPVPVPAPASDLAAATALPPVGLRRLVG